MIIEKEHTINNWLTDEYDYERPQRGEIREGVLLELDEYGAVVDVGFKHDGIVPREDVERLKEDTLSELEPGQEVKTRVVRPQDQEGNLVLSLSYLQEEQDWAKAQELVANDDIYQSEVVGYNRGGLLVKFGTLTGFVPASHLEAWDNKPMSVGQRKAKLRNYIGQNLSLKVLEAIRQEHRLVFSERLAIKQVKEQRRAARLPEFTSGQVCWGIVSDIVDFGAFIDLDGIEGLLHISEMAWRRVRHPSDVVEVGEELELYILDVDYDRNRINLSLKRLQPNPWERIEELYEEGQLVWGTVTNVVEYGAFVLLDSGVEGLLHISEIADPTPDAPREFVQRSDRILLRILQIDAPRQRIGLSLKRVSEIKEESNEFSVLSK